MRCVHEVAAADVDALMTEVVEEDEIARLEIAPRDRDAVAVLRDRAVWQRDPDLGEHVHREARAIEAGRACAAPDVRDAEILHGDGDDRSTAGRRHRWWRRCGRGRGR